ncbi:hypothetical protein P7D31_09890 [Enterococcus dongliensis]|uniref:hypothetical protein n=1 Tax=Enterococcus dongliensis TaxID=2559925 RepID=UPI00288EB8AA|nr:hypothetical protein [Enterococcus dongliensis]MDT2640426.1 hypothetical protein [Enterococcus dongliensis]
MKQSTKEIKRCADMVERRMISNGVVVQRYDSYTTNSVYFKFDGGLANSLRIGDHKGKKHLNYMFMININHKGNMKVTKGQFFQYTYGPTRHNIYQLVDHILRHRRKRINQYKNIDEYRETVKKQFMAKSDQKGFWKQSKLIESKQMEWLHEDIRQANAVIR